MKILLLILISLSLGLGVFYSHHGLQDVIRLQKQMKVAKERVEILEAQNQKLKHRLSLLEKPTEDMLEREVRDFLGWVSPQEIVYLEPSSSSTVK